MIVHTTTLEVHDGESRGPRRVRYDVEVEDRGDHASLTLRRDGATVSFGSVSYFRFGLYTSPYRMFHSYDDTLEHEISRMRRSIGRHHDTWIRTGMKIGRVMN